MLADLLDLLVNPLEVNRLAATLGPQACSY
jgi:hypothetical protein